MIFVLSYADIMASILAHLLTDKTGMHVNQSVMLFTRIYDAVKVTS